MLTSACVVELTHLASLYHDDVMDEADLRRGAESANARWDNHVAILTGDFLFSKSSELTADLGPDAVRIQAQTFTRLVEGQILETLGPTDGEDPLEHYLRVVAGKTGSLIATSARYGARFAGAPLDVEEALTEYGEKVGVAFQLSDDILDVASETEESGKTPGTDLREGVPTLPVLIAQRSTDPADARLLELLGRAAHRRRPPRRGARPAPGPPGDGRGPCLRRRTRRRGEGAAQGAPGGSRPRGTGGVRRRGRGPIDLSDCRARLPARYCSRQAAHADASVATKGISACPIKARCPRRPRRPRPQEAAATEHRLPAAVTVHLRPVVATALRRARRRPTTSSGRS